ncbi:MAG: two-component sensor histidine kinase [Alphaproteobacteria bacterium]|nr:MAG: two-component sensor histidine kinase [Alphaproteobacteria bacterium]
MSEPVVLLDAERRVTWSNSAAKNLFSTRIEGRDFGLFARQPELLAAIADVQGDMAHRRTAEIITSQPQERQWMVVASRIPPQEETRIRASGVARIGPPVVLLAFHDITHVKLVERMRADFVANASHELRTPLSSLLGFIETLRGPARDDAAARERFLAIMEEEARRMVRLVDDLLSLSRIESDTALPADARADLGEVVARVTGTLAPLADEHDIRFVLEKRTDDTLVHGDSDQLVQMVSNLVENAIKYGGEKGSVTIRLEDRPAVTHANGPGENGSLLLEVIDEGPGIAPEHLPRLTERFYRVDTARSRAMGGTGLGLAIVKHIVRRHEGELVIFSTPGVGTRVRITLPRMAATRTAKSPPRSEK